MATKAQLAQYCLDHGYTLATQVNQGTNMSHYLPAFLTINNFVVGTIGWVVGHWGIRPVAKWIYTKIRSLIPTQTVTPVTTTPVVTSTSSASLSA